MCSPLGRTKCVLRNLSAIFSPAPSFFLIGKRGIPTTITPPSSATKAAFSQDSSSFLSPANPTARSKFSTPLPSKACPPLSSWISASNTRSAEKLSSPMAPNSAPPRANASSASSWPSMSSTTAWTSWPATTASLSAQNTASPSSKKNPCPPTTSSLSQSAPSNPGEKNRGPAARDPLQSTPLESFASYNVSSSTAGTNPGSPCPCGVRSTFTLTRSSPSDPDFLSTTIVLRASWYTRVTKNVSPVSFFFQSCPI